MRSPTCAVVLAAIAALTLAGCGSGKLIEMGAVPPVAAEPQQVEAEISSLKVRVDALEEQLTSQAISEEEAEDIREQIASLRNTIALLVLLLDDLERQLANVLPGLFDPSVSAGIPSQTIERDQQSPIVATDGIIHVGANVAPEDFDTRLVLRSSTGGVDIYSGVLPADVGEQEVYNYLWHDYAKSGSHVSGNIRRFGAAPPTIRIGYRADDELTDIVMRAVQIINAALPHDYQLEISSFPAFATDPRNGEVSIEFGPREDWPAYLGYVGDADGIARSWNNASNTIVKGRIWIDQTRRTTVEERVTAVVHELLHILGRDHASPLLYPDTIMHAIGEGVEGHSLHPLDVAALRAVYLAPEYAVPVNTLIVGLGPWNDSATHFLADFGHGVAAGVTSDLAGDMPWAYGPAPFMPLADNTALSGTARWTGVLVGWTAAEPARVTGRADMAVTLADLTGELDFTGLWNLETQAAWGDGDLGYDVIVEGNTFVQTEGDEGVVTGAFFRASHEAMGGTLERSDLTAAFGGTRELSEPLPGSETTPATPSGSLVGTTGSHWKTGTESYNEFSLEHPIGSFEGTRDTRAYSGWGLWGEVEGARLFTATIGGTNFQGGSSASLFDPYFRLVSGTRSFDNPSGSGSITWRGKARAYETHPTTFGTPVEGTARIEMDLDSILDTVDVTLGSFDRGHPNMSWNGVFVFSGSFTSYLNGTLDGDFYGDSHEGAAGKFDRDGLKGVLGAVRE